MMHADAETVDRLLDYPGLIEALRAAHRADLMPQSRVEVMSDDHDDANKFVSLIAWAGGDLIAVKLVGVFPGNLALNPPQPSVQGMVALMSGRTGAPLLTADGAALTFRKTAADSALAADFLARSDARTLLVIGAGGLAPHVIAAHLAVRPSITRVLVWNRTLARAENLVQSLRHLPAELAVVSDLRAALPEADIISCVTMATEPLVLGRQLKPGAHVDLIGAYLPEMREADDDVVRRARLIFVDTRTNCEGSGEIAAPLAHGLVTREDIIADLFDLCTGRHSGRSSDEQVTMYKNVGGSHLDLFTARHLLARLSPVT
ncbi:ornithine cyclodeaminase [Taklimakanibacter albus]|uniref:Ornithine cyclodeaminase n=1 Tax=Taklimakanibacter albus TaxID=2800327 RepID=A0ACC5QYV1_9HYPH|nr:ornithine cyclodeaminase [Aestuariivirga sp. YIM B02566]MBK1865544.1 ornithine cyclodeaminase [Aestuariivirga sp. YIM B02566]